MNSISIIGLGSMASALAHRAVAGGNAVEVIGRDQTKAKELAAAVGGAAVGTPGIAPVGEIVILAVPYASAAVVVSEYGDALRGKVIIDITNPMTSDFTGLVTPRAVPPRRRSPKWPRGYTRRQGVQHPVRQRSRR